MVAFADIGEGVSPAEAIARFNWLNSDRVDLRKPPFTDRTPPWRVARAWKASKSKVDEYPFVDPADRRGSW